MKKYLVLFALIVSTVLMACSGEPKLDTKSEVGYKESLKKILDSQKSESEKKDVANGIMYTVNQGKDSLGDKNINQIFSVYGFLHAFGSDGLLMPLDGKTAKEIITVGYESRKAWILEDFPERISRCQATIKNLEEKKDYSEQVRKTKDLAKIDNVRMEYAEELAHGTNKPMGIVTQFEISFDAINDGSVDIYSFELAIKITDKEKEGATIWDSQKRCDFSSPVKPGERRSAKLAVGSPVHWIPYGENRYVLEAKLVNTDTSKDFRSFGNASLFSEYDEKSLAEEREELDSLEKELQRFK